MRISSAHIRMIVAASIAGALCYGLVAVPPATAQDGDERSQEGQYQSIADIRSCLSALPEGERILDVVYLMDGSGSLYRKKNGEPGTDVDGLRFEAVERSLSPLAQLAQSGIQVNVAAATFGDGARIVKEWVDVSPESGPALGQDLAQALRKDYQTANLENTNWLEGVKAAQMLLEEKAASTRGCQVLIWVTDGGINVKNNDSAANEAAIAELCGVSPRQLGSAVADGLMFQLRDSKVIILGLLLSPPDDESQEAEGKATYFGPMVEGSGLVKSDAYDTDGQFLCGDVVRGYQGSLINAASANDLANQLWALTLCISEECIPDLNGPANGSNGIWNKNVPQGVSELVVLSRDPITSITSPDGQERCAPDCGSQARIRTLGEPGTWTITTDPSSASPTGPYIVALTGIVMDVAPMGELQADELGVVQARVTQLGQPLADDAFGEEPVVTAEFIRAGETPIKVELDPKGNGVWETSGFRPTGPGTLKVDFNATSPEEVRDGVKFPALRVSSTVQQELAVTPPPVYPTLVPGQTLVFPVLEGRGPVTTEVALVGPKKGDGRACVVGDVLVERDAAGADIGGRTFDVGAPNDGCVEVRQGSPTTLTLTLGVDQQASGNVEGFIDLEMIPSDPSKESRSEAVPFEVTTTILKNQTAWLVTFILLFLIGLLVPYVALLLFVRRNATFPKSLDGARYAELPVQIGPEGLIAIGDKSVSDYAFIYMDKGSVQRTIETGVGVHRIRPPRLWPFAKARCTVQVGAPQRVMSNFSAKPGTDLGVAPSNQLLGDVFFVVVEPAEEVSGGVEKQDSPGWDDWEAAAVEDSSRLVAAAPADGSVKGKVVVIIPPTAQAREAAERAIGRVKAWTMWRDVHAMATAAQVGSTKQTKTPASENNAEKKMGQNSDPTPPPASGGDVSSTDW